MSLSGALSNAMSGLTANARGTTIISSNIANALNEYYGRRSVHLSTDANQSSGGVHVSNVSRHSNPIVTHQKRLAISEFNHSSTHSSAAKEIERLWGSIDTLGSVAAKLTDFEKSFISAANDPTSALRLQELSRTANEFANAIQESSRGIQSLRSRQEDEIDRSVDDLNVTLQRIHGLNNKIKQAGFTGIDAHGLLDQREELLENIAEYIPIHVIERSTGEVAVFTKLGQKLLDDHPVTLDFRAQSPIVPHMTIQNGLLARIEVNGTQVKSDSSGLFAGGKLAALFDLRDETAPAAQRDIDAIARDIIERFSGAQSPDTTLTTADPGVFTDGGQPFSVANEIGLAGRIALNDKLIGATAEHWRWRDGLNAATPGEEGNSTLLQSLYAQIGKSILPGSTSLDARSATLVDHVQGYSAHLANSRVRLESQTQLAFTQKENARVEAVADGVNSDQELQQLLELEKAYSANARVLRVVDDMLSELLRV